MATKWQTVRVFISSTFLDMHAERDLLLKEVFPDLRQELKKDCLHIVEIDLRWGINEKNAWNIVDICREEIDRSRPFFIGLLGSRYGWAPEGVSITETEIEYAVLSLQEKIAGSFFYFRNDSFLSSLETIEQKKMYLDLLDSGAIDETAQRKLNDLKQIIRESNQLVHDYRVQWDHRAVTAENYNSELDKITNDRQCRGRITGLQDLAQKMKQQLLEAIRARYAAKQVKSDPLQEEQAMHQAFAQGRSFIHIGRQQKKQLNDYVQSEQNKPVVILGEPGSGKSSFLAQWYQEYSEQSPDWIFLHFIGASPDSTSVEKLLARLCRQLQKDFSLKGDIVGNMDVLSETLQNFLGLVAQKAERLIIILDALDQLNFPRDAHLLNWLPSVVPNNVRFVLSTLPGNCLENLERREIYRLVLEPLAEKEKEKMVIEVLKTYGKKLSEKQSKTLLQNPGTCSPLFLRVALEELRLFGSYQNLDTRIQEFPQEIIPLFQQMLTRLETEHGLDLVEILCFIQCSRYGLEEREIIDLLSKQQGDAIPPARWARLYRTIEPYLIRRDVLFGFFHRHFEQAVQSRYLSPQISRHYHSILADFFETAPLDRKIAELPYHLLQSEQWQRLGQLLANLEFFMAATIGENFTEIISYWGKIANQVPVISIYHQSLEKLSTTMEDRKNLIEYQQRVANLLGLLGHNDQQLSLLQKSMAISVEEMGENHPSLATTYNDIGYAYVNKNQHKKAIEFFEKSLKISLHYFGDNHAHVATTYNNLAGAYKGQKKYEQAVEFFEKALAIFRQNFGAEHPHVATCCNNIAVVYFEQQKHDKAVEFFDKARELYLQNLGAEHPQLGTIYFNMGSAYKQMKDFVKAKEYLTMAWKIFHEKLGINHIHTEYCKTLLEDLE